MVIKINSELFKDLSNLSDINFLITIFSESRRYVYFCEIEEIRSTEVFSSLLPLQKKLIEENFNYVINQSTDINYEISQNATQDTFNVIEAKRFFNQQFLLILENNLNDGYFIDALINNFKKKSKTIQRHKDNGWFVYGNGGGCDNIINFIKGLMNSFNGLPKETKEYLRCMVLVDSDNEFQTITHKPDRIKLLAFLDDINIPYHVLEKREIENYMPDEVLEALPDSDDYLHAYLKLSPIQKDYFDLEKGFNNKNIKSFSKEIQDLFFDLDDMIIGILRKGMSTPGYEKGINFKSEFPKLFKHEKVSQETLKERTKHQINDSDELQTVLTKITNLL